MKKSWIVWGFIALLAITVGIMAISIWLDPNWLQQPNWSVQLFIVVVLWVGGALIAVADTVFKYLEYRKGQRTSLRGKPQRGSPGRIIPDPSSLPTGSKAPPFSTNPHFTGREDDLRQLCKWLVDEPQPRPVVLTGAGGGGKSQLAGEFLYRYGGHFAGVHWINAAQPDLIETELAECGRSMDIQPWPEKLEDQVAVVLHEWQKEARRLVVFDNLEQPAVLRAWLPRLGGARVLVTARHTDWRDDLGVQIWKVEPLEPDSGRGLLRDLAPHLETVPDAALDRVTERLGGLPLALDLSGRHFNLRANLTPDAFLTELDQQGGAAKALAFSIKDEDTPTQHTTDLFATYLTSWNLLKVGDTVDALSRRIFRCASWCAPNHPIPSTVLRDALEELEGEENNLQNAAFEMAMARLHALGLLERVDGGSSIHPLLADFARAVEENGPFPAAVASVLGNLGHEANNSGLYSRYLPLLAHIEHAANWSEREALGQAGDLWNTLGRYYRHIAAYDRALPVLQKSFDLLVQMRGAEHNDTAAAHNNLGLLLQDLNQLPEARVHFERALEIGEKTLPPDHSNLGNAHSNLGLLLQAMGELPKARVHLERALEISEKALPPDHPDLGTMHNNLGTLLQDLNQLPEARIHLERDLEISEKALPPDHPSLGISHNNMGTLLKDMGELPEARVHLERALDIGEKTLPPDHPDLGTRHNNLGLLLQAMSKLPEARIHLERALEISEKALPPDHPGLGTIHNNLGRLLKAMGELSEAYVHYKRALEISEKALPPDHPSLGIRHNNLGRLLRDMGELSEARVHLERGLAIREQALPAFHPDIAQSHNNLGLLLKDMSELPEARTHLERALEIFTASLPENHPHIKIVRDNLEGLKGEMGEG